MVSAMNSNSNDILERYLQAIGQFLSLATREDTLAELRANLLEQMEVRSEELGRPLTEAETADILRSHGRPEVVAARYLPQRSLIGPALFPVYLFTLRRALPLVIAIYAIARGVALIFAPAGPASASQIVSQIVDSVIQLVPTLLFFWGTVTIVFAVIEVVQAKRNEASKRASAIAWDPRKLPPVKVEQKGMKRRSLTSRIADLVVHCLWMGYCFSVPSHPFLLIGPGLSYLDAHHVAFAPVWHMYFLLLVALLLVQFATKAAAVLSEESSEPQPLKLMTDIFAIAAAAYMAFAGDYFVATSAAANLHTLASVNHGMTLAFRIALFFAVLGLITDSWKSVKRYMPTERFAF